MKLLVILTSLVQAVAPAGEPPVFLLGGGKELAGIPTGLVKDQAGGAATEITLAATDGSPAASVAQARVLEVRVAGAQEAPRGDHALLTLNNGDSLRGILTDAQADSLTVRTSFAGDLKFRREMVKSLEFIHATPQEVLTEIKSADWGLRPPNNGWTLKGRSLISHKNGSAQCKLSYPERFRLTLDLAWRPGRKADPSFQMTFMAKMGDGKLENGYTFYCQGDYIDLISLKTAESLGDGGSEFSSLRDKDQVRLELLVDSRSGLMALVIDGKLIEQWVDPAPQPSALADRFEISTEDGPPMRIARMSLAAWDGNLRTLAADDPGPGTTGTSPNELILTLRNGDVVNSTMLAVVDGHAEVSTIHGPIRIPLNRMRSLALPKPPGNPPTPKKMSGDVRGWFADGGRITFRLDDLKDGKVTGFSQQFGTAEFDLHAFERIEMNLGNLELEPQRLKLDW